MIKKTKCHRKGKFLVLHLVRVMESLVTVFSFGYLKANWYGDLLFSDWADDIDSSVSDFSGLPTITIDMDVGND
jgi:hypothetical protein